MHQYFTKCFKICLKKLLDKNNIGDQELEQIFTYHRHFLVRKFLNELIASHLSPSEQKERRETS
jgi:hypothetical protein